MLSLAFPGSPLAGAYPLSRGYSCATIASRLRLRTLPYVVNRIPHPRHAVEGSKITIESVSKASERLWFRLHTAPWFKPFRSAGVLLLGKPTQGLFAIVFTALAARALRSEERRVGKEGARPCKSGWAPSQEKKKKKKKH